MIVLGELRLSIPDDLHKSLKKKALEYGKSLKTVVIEALYKEVAVDA